MQAADLPAVMQQEQQAYPIPWTESAMRQSLASDSFCEVAYGQDGLVAHMVSQSILDEMHLYNICVSPSQQGQGIGAYMLQHLIDNGQRLGAKHYFLEVRASNAAAIALYQRTGFEIVGERRGYYRGLNGREDALVMRLEKPE